jgi:Kef-type K+ transport system membrane component KefB
MLVALLEHLVVLRDLLATHVLFTVGVMLLSGYAIGILAGKIGLPEITGFIIAGVLLGESLLGIVPQHLSEPMKVVTEIALGLIALTIGSEFSFGKLRRMGRPVLVIAVLQLAGTFLFVFGGMLLAGLALPFALIIASISTTSSPSIIVAVVQSLRARGLFVDYIYGVVALLDAAAVILFGICFSIAAGLLGWGGSSGGGGALMQAAILEVVFSILVGAVMGILLHYGVYRKNGSNEIMLVVLGLTCFFTAIAIVFHLSPLLMNMVAGAVMINLTPRHHRIFRMLEPITPPVYALFFVLAGIKLQLGLFTQPPVLLLGAVYVVCRNLAKWSTVYVGARATGCSVPIQKNLGFCMLPQAGVALGLVLLVQASPLAAAMTEAQEMIAETLVNVVLLSVFINELVGPPLARMAIIRGNLMEEE